MNAKDVLEITMGCYDITVITEIESEIIRRAENGYNFIDIINMFDYDLDYQFMFVVESYFKQNGFVVNFYCHSKEEYRKFIIQW